MVFNVLRLVFFGTPAPLPAKFANKSPCTASSSSGKRESDNSPSLPFAEPPLSFAERSLLPFVGSFFPLSERLFPSCADSLVPLTETLPPASRSEERRVGKE